MPKTPKPSKEITEMLDYYAAKNKASREQRKLGPLPSVGIFFVYDNRPLIDSTPVNEAQPYGDFKGHAKGHPDFWRNLQRNGIVPADVEYDEVPRGRVGFDNKEKCFLIFMDKCILENHGLVDRIRTSLSLPSASTAPPRLDSHYKCPGCKKKSVGELKQEEEDWDF